MEQSKSLGENSVWEHPLWPRIVRNEEKNKKFFKEIRWITFSNTTSRRLNAGWWGSWKLLLDYHRRVHLSSSRWAQSQTVHAERRNISYSNKVHQNNIYITGRIVVEKYWRLLEHRLRKRIVGCMDRIHKIRSTEGKATKRIHMVREETCEETNNLSSWWCMARCVEIYFRSSEKESKAK